MTYAPFGFRYEGETCSIKLRFTQKSFDENGLKDYGTFRPTTGGYIIFETQLNIKDDKFIQLSQRLKAMKTTK